MAVTETTREQMRAVVARYPRSRSAMMPLLHLVQADEGRITPEGIAIVAEELGLTDAEVTAVATFYTMYVRHDPGRYRLGVCVNSLCAVMGGDALWEELSEYVGCGHDESTADGMFSLERIECQAACTHAPVMTANWEFLDDMTVAKAKDVVDRLRAGEDVRSTRGPVVREFTDAERTIAGVDDGLADEGDVRDDRMLAGLRAAKANGDLDRALAAQAEAAAHGAKES